MRVHPSEAYTVHRNVAAVMPPRTRHSPYPISIKYANICLLSLRGENFKFAQQHLQANGAQLGFGPLNIYQLLTLRMMAVCNRAP